MKIHKSKIDWWLIIIVFAVLSYPIIQSLITKDYLITVLFLVILIVVALLFRTVKYKIDDTTLYVGWTKIDIRSIRKIYKTRNPLSSPALSLDRIALVYNKYDEILLSPKDKITFVNDLLLVNNSIIVTI